MDPSLHKVLQHTDSIPYFIDSTPQHNLSITNSNNCKSGVLKGSYKKEHKDNSEIAGIYLGLIK